LRLGLVLDFPRKFPDGAERLWLGMFFETVNRIWRQGFPSGSAAVGWDGLSECVCKLAKA
jgi:hypothetical protein